MRGQRENEEEREKESESVRAKRSVRVEGDSEQKDGGKGVRWREGTVIILW